MSQELRVVPAALLESALKTLAGVAPGRFAVEPELRAIVDAPVTPAGGEVELPRPVMKLEAEKLWGRDGEYAVSFERPGWLQQCREKGGTFPLLPLGEIKPIIERLQAENAALQQRLNVADQQIDDLQHERSQILEVNPHSLRAVLTALVGAPHEIREIQACRGLPDNAIDQLLREYNAWVETPAPASSPQ